MMTTELTTYDCATIRRQLAAELRVDIDRIRVRVRGRRQKFPMAAPRKQQPSRTHSKKVKGSGE